MFTKFIQQLYFKIGGFFVCDPMRLNLFLGENSRGTDLLEFFSINDNLQRICEEGIGISIASHDSDTFTLVIRHFEDKSYLNDLPKFVSQGWILNTDTGKLAISDFGSLMFWDPFEEEETPPRYYFLDIPNGWYTVEIAGGINENTTDEELEQEYIFEIILTPVEARPNFSGNINSASDDYKLSDKNQVITISPEAKQSTNEEFLNATEKETLRLLLSRLNNDSFVSFVTELFSDTSEPFKKLSDAGENIFYKPLLDSYGQSLHSVFLLQYLPLGLLAEPILSSVIMEPLLENKLESVKKLYDGKFGHFGMVSELLIKAQKLQSIGFILNLNGLDSKQYEDTLFPIYKNLVKKHGIQAHQLLLGTYDSFLDLNAQGASEAFRSFLTNTSDGISISLSANSKEVAQFSYENSLTGGVLSKRKHPYEPIYLSKLKQKAQAILEFESLLKEETKEEDLEKFLTAHYRDIFGSHYDRIETQIWLRFPDIDIAGKDRRLDVFLRNSVANDWELFEIKRIVPLTSVYRDIPVIAKEIVHAIQQTKNYERTLSQKTVKDEFAKAGIEYFEPSLHLVVGKTPQIPHEQWRWLTATNGDKVKIITFDDLIKEMKTRLTDKLEFLSKGG